MSLFLYHLADGVFLSFHGCACHRWEDSDDLAAQSREFIQAGLTTARRMQRLTAGQVD